MSVANDSDMRITEWLQKTGMTQRAFAELIGVTQGRVSQICASGTDSLSTAAKIEKATGGEVSASECRKVEVCG